MAAIVKSPAGSGFVKIGEAHVDAEVDKWWIETPPWARYAQVWLTVTTLGGTSLQLTLNALPAWALVDTHVILLREAAAPAAITAADVSSVVDIGPGVTGIADDVTGGAAADSYMSINTILPPILGVWVTGVGTGANVYNLSVLFRK